MSTRHEYHTDVQDIAEEIHGQWKDEGPSGDFDVHTAVHESVDGSSWVIYTAQARQVLDFSDNDCAIFEEMGPQEWEDWSTAFSQSAYFAMTRDVWEALHELGEPTWECKHCGADLDDRWDDMDEMVCLDCEERLIAEEKAEE